MVGNPGKIELTAVTKENSNKTAIHRCPCSLQPSPLTFLTIVVINFGRRTNASHRLAIHKFIVFSVHCHPSDAQDHRVFSKGSTVLDRVAAIN